MLPGTFTWVRVLWNTGTNKYLMTTVAPLVAAVVAGLAARLAGEGPL